MTFNLQLLTTTLFPTAGLPNRRRKTLSAFRSALASAVTFTGVLALAVAVNAQDSVFKIADAPGRSRVSGKITGMSPAGVTIGDEEIPAAQIRKVQFAKEPSEVDRARDQMEAGRFGDAISTLEGLDAGGNPLLQHEIDFIRVNSLASQALIVGAVTARDAGREVSGFVNKYPNSFHFWPATEQFGKLLFAVGQIDLAIGEFSKLAACDWPEFQQRGAFAAAEAMLVKGDFGQAEQVLDTILANQSNDDLSQQYKLLAKALKAKLVGQQGNLENAKSALDELIRNENPDNKQLFAVLYNALGGSYQQAGKLNEAARAYLHTELLFASEADSHAEALYHLALIWPKLGETDRANLARETLKSRYRNSYWASKL